MGKGHAKRLVQAGAEVVAVCDKNQNARKQFLQETEIPAKEYECFEQMLEECEFTALIICLPPFAQTDQFEKAASAGKPIFIEKPIALSSEVGKRMVEAAVKNKIITQVGFHMRHGAAVRRLYELMEEGKTGRPVLFQGNYQCNSLHTPWWINVDLCGGQIFEQAIHLYDMARFLFGNPKSVQGVMNNLCHSDNRGYTVEDVSASIAVFTNGAISSITANNCAIPGKWVGSFTAVFEKVTVQFQDHNHGVFTFTDSENLHVEEVASELDPYQKEIDEFVLCIQQKHETGCNILEGYKSLVYVENVVKSANSDGNKISFI